jgi:hypothetical protein
MDMAMEELRRLEIVVAASRGVRLSTDQTGRMLRGRTPGVHILGHPRGRKYGSRPGISADWSQVFEEAARHGSRSRSTATRLGRTWITNWRTA